MGPRTKPIKVSLPHVTNTRHPYFEVYRDLQKLKQKTKPARTLNDTNTTNLQSLQHPAGGLRNSQDETSSQRRFPAREPTPQDQLALKRLVLDACEQGRAHLLTLSNTMIGVELFGVVLGSNQLIEVDWVEVVPEKIIVNRAGIEQLEEQYQRRLRQLARASSLREWLESNGRFVFGHVQFGNGEIRGKLEDDGRLFLNLEDALAISGKGATRLKHIQTVNINAQEYRLHPFNLKVDISDLKRLLKEEPKETQTESGVAA